MGPNSVYCCVTSPPYWGLRDYGVDGQLGLEKTPEEYVGRLVGVFEEVRRVLRDDGTLWLNLGDSYARAGGWSNNNGLDGLSRDDGKRPKSNIPGIGEKSQRLAQCLKPKDLVGIPWRVAFALQAAGWYLRQDIIWHKPNPMPESVTDRCTKAHEYVFLLSKSQKYYYDADAIREFTGNEASVEEYEHLDGRRHFHEHDAERGMQQYNPNHKAATHPLGRNRRSVWTIPTQPYPEAHFATFPEALVEPCILAGCPEDGVVLDPFGGSGTTGAVALRNNRKAILLELNPDYVKLAKKRVSESANHQMTIT